MSARAAVDDLAERLRRALGPAYELGPLLGRGAMGAVFQAYDCRLKRDVAVKVLLPTMDNHSGDRERFVREAQTAAGLSHPNIVPIFSIGEGDDLVWFVMARVQGESLRAKVDRHGAPSLARMRRILEDVGQALAYSHARGIVHRDIKPENILIDDGTSHALVMDFGIAKSHRILDPTTTQTGILLGTPRYASPEQLLGGGPLDGRADMYSLGLVGCFMISGRDAIQATYLPEIIAAHFRGVAVDLNELESRAPGPLFSVLARCLAPLARDRFARMEEFIQALAGIADEVPAIRPSIQLLFQATERALLISSLTILALGWAGVSRVPAVFSAFVLGWAGVQWIVVQEHAVRQGVTWPIVRSAIYAERARRLEERSERQTTGWGHRTRIVFLLWAAALLGVSWIDVGRTGYSLGDAILFGIGLSTMVALTPMSGLRRVYSSRLPGLVPLMLMFFIVPLLVALFVSVVDPRHHPLTMVVGIAVLLVIMPARHSLFRGPETDALEWRIPWWLDLAGSVIFGRFVRRGLRIGFQRDVGRPRASGR